MDELRLRDAGAGALAATPHDPGRVTTLDLSGAGDALPPLSQYRALRRLYLERRDLDTLPAELGELDVLEELHLDHNRLTELPVLLRELPRLRVLSVYGNRIERLPTWLAELDLRVLSMGRNPLVQPPAELAGLVRPAFLNLGECGLE